MSCYFYPIEAQAFRAGPCEDCHTETTEKRATRVGRSIATIFLCNSCDDNRGLTAKASLLRIERPHLSSEDIAAQLTLKTKRPVSYIFGRFPFKFVEPKSV